MSHDNGLGKRCPDCGSPMVDLRSMNTRLCSGCKTEFDWHLAPGQKPLISNNRIDRKEQTA
jgi:DNA-directed RNA polymerase subunit RPC12/RpoP